MEPTPGLKTYAEWVNVRLSALLPPVHAVPTPLHEAMHYSALAPGKRLRPALCMESARAVGGSPQDVLDAACALELVHAFSLVHDDLPALDNDDLRRGRATCHIEFGEATAIMAGDALFALAFRTLRTQPGTDTQCAVAMGWLADTALELVQGETLDLLSEGAEPSADTLEFIHRRKTGSLIACACAFGGHFGGGTQAEVAALRSYGEHLGLAFQIADDVLNETASAETLGKAAGSDKARGKLTYPALYGIQAAKLRAREESDKATECLRLLSGPTEALLELARFSVERSS